MDLVAKNEKKSKRGFAKYNANPFLLNVISSAKVGSKRISNSSGDRMLVVNENTGEYVAPAGFWHTQEVDKTQFIKLFINGVKAFKNLTNAGTRVFEILYMRMQDGIGKDVVYMSFTEVDQTVTQISKATFMKGMRELIEKSFLAESVTQNKYFINPDYVWNGDRLAFVKEFRLKNSISNKERLEAMGQGVLKLESEEG